MILASKALGQKADQSLMALPCSGAALHAGFYIVMTFRITFQSIDRLAAAIGCLGKRLGAESRPCAHQAYP